MGTFFYSSMLLQYQTHHIIKIILELQVPFYVGNRPKDCGGIFSGRRAWLPTTLMLAGIRNTFAKEELNDYLIELDLTEPIAAKMTPEVRLSQALAEMERHGIDCIPVIASQQDDKYVGVLENSAVRRQLSAKVLDKQHEADSKFALHAG
jgi:hypothetical protein